MAKKAKGTSGTRARNQTKRTKNGGNKGKAPTQDLEWDMAMQRAGQVITDRYEKEIKTKEKHHRKEMQNFLDGQKSFVKPRWIDRLMGRYKDLYLVYNHLQPIYCHKSNCPTKSEGVNWGIEVLTLDLDVALGYIDEYFENYPNHGSAKLLHIQIDRRTNRTGQVVSDHTFLLKDWDSQKKRYIRDDMESESVEHKILASLAEDRRKWKRGRRRGE
jgi:hypothetical protein